VGNLAKIADELMNLLREISRQHSIQGVACIAECF
jgi:hypothetical protein